MTTDPYRSLGLTFATTEEQVQKELQLIQDRPTIDADACRQPQLTET
jgi:hypothetical protein